MTLVALREFSLGEHGYKPGDEIPPAVQVSLPAGRVETLKTHRYIHEVAQDLTALEARVTALEAKRGPGRPRKTEEN